MDVLRYYDFINETKMTPEKDGYHLELNDKGKLLPPFSYYYDGGDMNNNNYFVFKSITPDEYDPGNNRVTLLNGVVYLDNIIPNKKGVLLNDVDFDPENYYFYKIVSTRRNLREIHGISIKYDSQPDRFEDQLTEDGKLHYIAIFKNSIVYTVRLNSGGRHGGGDKAEKIISSKFNWELEQTNIRNLLVRNEYDNDGIIPDAFYDATLSDLLKFDINILKVDKYKDIFSLSDEDRILSKHDLVITNGENEGKKIEVKKYGANDLFYKIRYKKGESKKILVSEQLKISTKPGLKKLVELYKDANPAANVAPLLNNYRVDGGLELSNYFNEGGAGEHRDLIYDIREFYNSKISIMKEKYDRIPNNRIMTDVFGIYFFNKDSGVDGFLIKNENNNLSYTWGSNSSHWGLERITLYVTVNSEAKRFVWLGDLSVFVETFEVGNLDLIPSKENSIIEDTILGKIKWSGKKGYWVVVSDKEAKDKRGIVLKSIRKSGTSN